MTQDLRPPGPRRGTATAPGSRASNPARGRGTQREVTLQLRVDTPIEVNYLRHGGILPYVLHEPMAEKS